MILIRSQPFITGIAKSVKTILGLIFSILV